MIDRPGRVSHRQLGLAGQCIDRAGRRSSWVPAQALWIRRLAQVLDERADIHALGAFPPNQTIMQETEPPQQIER